MNETMKRYEELINRLFKSDEWLKESNHTTWEEVKISQPKVYQLRQNLIYQIETIQKTIHNKR